MHNPSSFNQEKVFTISKSEIERLQQESLQTERKVKRICLHSAPEEWLHEMLIVHQKNAYVRPHKHIQKSESFHIVDGELDVFLFSDTGEIIQKISMGTYSSGKIFCYRLSASLFHTVLPRSEQVTFHEITNGPFIKSETIWAPWAPEEENKTGVDSFLSKLLNYPR